ncbi:MAG: hypothetical protein KGN31_02185 [Betaproteobacteria bacterium]|nr:hypothetical protein [Betaproteobacteria bacterium]
MRDILHHYEIRPDKPLKKEYLKLLELFDRITRYLKINYFLVGAQARDLIISNVYNKSTGQATYDLDLAVCIEDWEKFNLLKVDLIKTGMFFESKQPHKLYFKEFDDQFSIPLDLIPFGKIENKNSEIKWPPEMVFVMNVCGFSEAYLSSLLLKINENLTISIASLPAMAVLKLIAWKERGRENLGKDASDFLLIALNYYELGNLHRLYAEETEILESVNYDPQLAGLHLLGRDAAGICYVLTKQHIQAIFTDEEFLQKLKDQLTSNQFILRNNNIAQNIQVYLDLFYKGFMKAN